MKRIVNCRIIYNISMWFFLWISFCELCKLSEIYTNVNLHYSVNSDYWTLLEDYFAIVERLLPIFYLVGCWKCWKAGLFADLQWFMCKFVLWEWNNCGKGTKGRRFYGFSQSRHSVVYFKPSKFLKLGRFFFVSTGLRLRNSMFKSKYILL